MLIDQVVTRIDDQVPAIKGRIHQAGDLASLVRKGTVPQVRPAGFVLPLGLLANAADVVSGAYRQGTIETVGVIFFVDDAGQATGRRAIPKVDEIQNDIVNAIAGWKPTGENYGVFELSRGRLVAVNKGTVSYQLEFTISNQLRIL